MDEADFFVDRIAIINKGELLRNNTFVAIKNEFRQFNAIFSIKRYSEEKYQLLLTFVKHYYGNDFTLLRHFTSEPNNSQKNDEG